MKRDEVARVGDLSFELHQDIVEGLRSRRQKGSCENGEGHPGEHVAEKSRRKTWFWGIICREAEGRGERDEGGRQRNEERERSRSFANRAQKLDTNTEEGGGKRMGGATPLVLSRGNRALGSSRTSRVTGSSFIPLWWRTAGRLLTNSRMSTTTLLEALAPKAFACRSEGQREGRPGGGREVTGRAANRDGKDTVGEGIAVAI